MEVERPVLDRHILVGGDDIRVIRLHLDSAIDLQDFHGGRTLE